MSAGMLMLLSLPNLLRITVVVPESAGTSVAGQPVAVTNVTTDPIGNATTALVGIPTVCPV